MTFFTKESLKTTTSQQKWQEITPWIASDSISISIFEERATASATTSTSTAAPPQLKQSIKDLLFHSEPFNNPIIEINNKEHKFPSKNRAQFTTTRRTSTASQTGSSTHQEHLRQSKYPHRSMSYAKVIRDSCEERNLVDEFLQFCHDSVDRQGSVERYRKSAEMITFNNLEEEVEQYIGNHAEIPLINKPEQLASINQFNEPLQHQKQSRFPKNCQNPPLEVSSISLTSQSSETQIITPQKLYQRAQSSQLSSRRRSFLNHIKVSATPVPAPQSTSSNSCNQISDLTQLLKEQQQSVIEEKSKLSKPPKNYRSFRAFTQKRSSLEAFLQPSICLSQQQQIAQTQQEKEILPLPIKILDLLQTGQQQSSQFAPSKSIRNSSKTVRKSIQYNNNSDLFSEQDTSKTRIKANRGTVSSRRSSQEIYQSCQIEQSLTNQLKSAEKTALEDPISRNDKGEETGFHFENAIPKLFENWEIQCNTTQSNKQVAIKSTQLPTSISKSINKENENNPTKETQSKLLQQQSQRRSLNFPQKRHILVSQTTGIERNLINDTATLPKLTNYNKNHSLNYFFKS